MTTASPQTADSTTTPNGALPAGYPALLDTIERLRDCGIVHDDMGARADTLEGLAKWIADSVSSAATPAAEKQLFGLDGQAITGKDHLELQRVNVAATPAPSASEQKTLLQRFKAGEPIDMIYHGDRRRVTRMGYQRPGVIWAEAGRMLPVVMGVDGKYGRGDLIWLEPATATSSSLSAPVDKLSGLFEQLIHGSTAEEIERMATQWDGCLCKVLEADVDIGAAIRSAAVRIQPVADPMLTQARKRVAEFVAEWGARKGLDPEEIHSLGTSGDALILRAADLRTLSSARGLNPAESYADVLHPFVKLMRRELHANSHKGDRPGWMKMSRQTALLEIWWHVSKLQRATLGDEPAAICEHAADVANMAMMLVDVCGLLVPATKPTT